MGDDLTPIEGLIALLTGRGWFGAVQVMIEVCGLCAVLAAILPPATRRSPRWWKLARGIIDRFGANFRNARNRAS